MILPCFCECSPDGNTCGAKFQDAKYGKGMRVHNKAVHKGPKGTSKYRCTVCGREKLT